MTFNNLYNSDFDQFLISKCVFFITQFNISIEVWNCSRLHFSGKTKYFSLGFYLGVFHWIIGKLIILNLK